MKSLVIYFSRADENYGVGNIDKGNTEVIAEYIGNTVNAELFRCDPVKAYSKSYSKCCDEALVYQRQDARPPLKKYLTDISEYDVIYIGGPVYWGEYPYEIYSQLDMLDFGGKTVKPFVTHEGSGLGSCEKVLKSKCKGATIKEGLAIRGREVYRESAKIKTEEWAKK